MVATSWAVSDTGERYTAVASGTIVAGDMVHVAHKIDTVTSAGVSSLAWNDIKVCTITTALHARFGGIALNDAADAAAVTVCTEGIWILPTHSSAIADGVAIMASDGTANTVDTATAYDDQIGRGLTSTAGSGYIVVKLGL